MGTINFFKCVFMEFFGFIIKCSDAVEKIKRMEMLINLHYQHHVVCRCVS